MPAKPSPLRPDRNRLATLDALRAVAVGLVLGRHMPDAAVTGNWALELWHRAGWIGVDLFFVLSGFLVSGLLFREFQRTGGIDCGRFLVRRGFKIYPAFYALLIVTAIYGAQTGKTLPWPILLSEGLFVQNYGPALFPHTWSLAIEEHFYLLLPAALLVLLRIAPRDANPFRRLVPGFLLVALLALAGRCFVTFSSEFHFKSHLFPTHLRIDSLLFGVVLSYGWHFHREALARCVLKNRAALAAAAPLLAAPAFIFPLGEGWFLPTFGLTCLYLASGIVLLLALLHKGKMSGGWGRALGVFGACSYSIYLWHIPVRFWIAAPLAAACELSPLEGAALYMGLSLLIGMLFARLLEAPVLALRDRWFPSHSAAAAAPAPARGMQLELLPLEAPAPARSA